MASSRETERALEAEKKDLVDHLSKSKQEAVRLVKVQGVPKLSVFYSMGLTLQPRGFGRCTMAHFVGNFSWFLAN